MKKIVFLNILFCVFISCNNESIDEQTPEATCDNGTFVGIVTLTTQEEVNDFGALCYTKIEGTLNIGYPYDGQNNITDLSPLTSLIEIYSDSGNTDNGLGTLGIYSNNLTNLDGLNNIKRVGRLLIQYCFNLTSIEGLEGLEIINIDFPNVTNQGLIIVGNYALKSLQGLNNLYRIGNDQIIDNISALRINGNNSIIDLDALSNVTVVYGNLFFYGPGGTLGGIAGNDLLSDFCGLENLLINGVYGNVGIAGNAYNPSVQDIIDGNCSE